MHPCQSQRGIPSLDGTWFWFFHSFIFNFFFLLNTTMIHTFQDVVHTHRLREKPQHWKSTYVSRWKRKTKERGRLFQSGNYQFIKSTSIWVVSRVAVREREYPLHCLTEAKELYRTVPFMVKCLTSFMWSRQWPSAGTSTLWNTG